MKKFDTFKCDNAKCPTKINGKQVVPLTIYTGTARINGRVKPEYKTVCHHCKQEIYIRYEVTS